MDERRQAIRRLFAEVSLGAPENAVGFVLWRVTHRFQREMDRVLAGQNLTHLQFTTLALVAWLSRDERLARQAEIARAGDIHPMQVSLMLKALEGKAMVARTRDPDWATANFVEITETGVDALRFAMPLAIELQHRMFGEEGRPGGPLLRALNRAEQGWKP